MCPKKQKQENTMKIDNLFDNMIKDSKNKQNKSILSSNRKKSKSKSKSRESSLKPKQKITSKKEPEEKISSKNKTKLKKESTKKKKIIDDDSSYEEKMDIEEEKPSSKKKQNKKDTKNNSKNKKSKKLTEDINEDLDLTEEELEELLESENSLKKTNKNNKKQEKTPQKRSSSNNKNKKSNSISNKKRGKSPLKSSNIIEGILSNETIVITGQFDISRDEITNILKSLGARVTGSVSSRTTILLHGDQLEDGRHYTEGRKYKEALKKNIKTVDMYTLEKIIGEKLKKPYWNFQNPNSDNNNNNKENNKENFIENIKKNNKKENIQNQNELWTTKYQPKKLNDLIGNKTTINKLITWLDDWNSVVLEGKTKKSETKFHRGQKPTFENINARACLITGEPGIGKTSSVRLIAKLKNYHTYETNASDQRNKLSINKNAGFMFDNKTLFCGEIQNKNLIIMDEVDGMSGNEDRGGIAAIIDIIKKTKTPIICIANDRQNPKLKTLANYCYDLKFVHPDKRAIATRLAEICENENIMCDINALEFLCEICGNDFRQCINYIELWAKNHKTLKFSEIANKDQKLQGKDEIVMIKNFDAAKELLNSKSKNFSFNKLLDLYFIDYDLIPLLIQENYLSTFSSQNFNNKKEELENISLASDLISLGDNIEKKIKSQMDWRLLADRGLIGCCTICKINKGFIPFPKFPEALGKISSLNKIKRETNELKECFKSYSGWEIRTQILPIFYSYMIDYIMNGDIENVLNLMKKYHVTMEMFKENMTDLVTENLKLEFNKIGTVNKSNLTRAYNKNFKNSIVKVKNKKGKNTINVNIGPVYDENGNPIGDEDFDIDDDKSGSQDSVVDINDKSKKSRGKSRNKSKSVNSSQSSQDNKKKGKTKGKGKKGKRKKSSSEDEFDDDDFDL